ncbi:MAG: bifunctional tetrahydrofolate synthase/dihydrofolate synthase [Legionella sp.]|nr:bifunctional tetrahydrofolate synthase/dihydrofolate synthase [Legionella sp.]
MKPFEINSSSLSLAEWLQTLEKRHTQEIQLGLDRIKEVAARLDLLKPRARVISVGGTNGKGSTVAALEAIYTTAGYQVACYTSPHLLAFNERIRVNKSPITDQALIEAFQVIENARQNIHLTYFEMATLAALWYFEHRSLDLILLEVGLGGRLDATNIIDSDLAIITTIDLDHQAFLGNTREAIGQEKAGILRPGRSFVYADHAPPQTILDAAAKLNCTDYWFDRDYAYEEQGDSLRFVSYAAKSMTTLPMVSPSATPIVIRSPRLHKKAIAAAIQTTFALADILPVKPQHIQESLEKVQLSGRLEWIDGQITTLLDVSHNPQAATYLSEYLKKQDWQGKIYAVFSALADKDIAGLIEPLLALVDTWYPACLTGNRAASKEQLSAAFKTYGIINFCFENPRAAYECAYRHATQGDLILVYGSFYTIASVYSVIDKHQKVII